MFIENFLIHRWNVKDDFFEVYLTFFTKLSVGKPNNILIISIIFYKHEKH